MKRMQFETMGGRIAKIAAPALVFFLSLTAPAVSQTNLLNAIPGAAVSSVITPPRLISGKPFRIVPERRSA